MKIKKQLLTILLLAAVSCGHAQQLKLEQEMKQDIEKLEQLIKDRLQKVKSYPEKPAYYLQVNKSGCRVLVSVNNIPLGFSFVEDEGESMLYPINDMLLSSGKHTVSIEVYPRSNEMEVTENAWVNIKVVYYKEKLVGMPETLTELSTPSDIGVGKLSLYSDSVSFDAKLPFDFRSLLSNARNLHKVPDLEKKVLTHYNKVRRMMINGAYYEYQKMRLSTTWPLTEMNHLGEDALRKAYIDADDLFRFLCNPIDWIAMPIENYEMIVCGNGKLVYLRRKTELDEVLRCEYYQSEELKQQYPDERTYVSMKFILLYMPGDSDNLVELY